MATSNPPAISTILTDVIYAEEDRALKIAPPINPRADWRVADVKALPGYKLRVRFNDAIEGEVDMSQLIQAPHAGVFAALRDEALFRKVHVALGAVTWPGGLRPCPGRNFVQAIRERDEWIVS